jgi:hypothetical protein
LGKLLGKLLGKFGELVGSKIDYLSPFSRFLMNYYFQFEADFIDSLRCIPMTVRYKLDTCGVKLKLQHWHQLSLEARQSLLELPCATETEIRDYRSYLQVLVHNYTGEFPEDLAVTERSRSEEWQQGDVIPESVQLQSQKTQSSLTPEQWRKFSPLQRFVLIKLSRSHHENKNFRPALQEFLDGLSYSLEPSSEINPAPNAPASALDNP